MTVTVEDGRPPALFKEGAVGGDLREYGSPRSSCGGAFSCKSEATSATTVFADAEESWDTLSSSSDGEAYTDEVAFEDPDEVSAVVHHHLEAMNVASDDVNSLQKELGNLAQQRQALVELWASGGTRLARSIGREGLVAAKACHAQVQCCTSAREAAEEAIMQYRKAIESGASADEVADHGASHAKHLAELRDGQARLALARKKLEQLLGKEALARAQAYIEAEEQYHEELAEIDDRTGASERRLHDAKERYQQALRGLESLSEQIHHSRGTM